MDAASISTIATSIAAALALVIKTITTSRCSTIKCCGLECDRDVLPPNEVTPTPNQNIV